MRNYFVFEQYMYICRGRVSRHVKRNNEMLNGWGDPTPTIFDIFKVYNNRRGGFNIRPFD